MASSKKVPHESEFRALLRRSERKADISFGKVVRSTLEALPPVPGVLRGSKLMARSGPARGGVGNIGAQLQP